MRSDIAPLIEKFLATLEARGQAAQTVAHKRHSLEKFRRWCVERGLHKMVDVTRSMMERYQRWLFLYRQDDGNPLSLQVQHFHLSTVKLFFHWLVKQGLVLHNACADLEFPKVPRRLPKNVLSVEEAELVLQQPDITELAGLRDRAILEMLYSTGMRRAEVSNLLVDDVDFNRGTLMIRLGKGRKDRVVPVGERALAWLKKYLDEVRVLFVRGDDHTLFLSRKGQPMSPGVLTNMVAKYVEKSGIGKTGACHMLRHTAATLMLEGGADIRFIQQLLGHALLNTTQIYTQVSIAKLKEVHDSTHPGALLAKPRRPRSS